MHLTNIRTAEIVKLIENIYMVFKSDNKLI